MDHFHIVKLANDAVTKVRRRVIWEQNGRRGRKIDPAWANRRRLLSARERLSDKAFTTMWNSLIDSDPSAQILTAWIAKEELRKVLALARTGARRDQIAGRLYDFYHWCAQADIDELNTLASTVETWWPAIEAFIDTGITNARTDGAPDLVLGEVVQWQVGQAGVFGVADPVVTAGRLRWRSSRSASWPLLVLVAKAVIRCPSASVIRSWAPGWGRSLRTMTRIPAG